LRALLPAATSARYQLPWHAAAAASVLNAASPRVWTWRSSGSGSNKKQQQTEQQKHQRHVEQGKVPTYMVSRSSTAAARSLAASLCLQLPLLLLCATPCAWRAATLLLAWL
jgi:hypothetical protein